jgi:tetratricopeptide (TPR) repeat protein
MTTKVRIRGLLQLAMAISVSVQLASAQVPRTGGNAGAGAGAGSISAPGSASGVGSNPTTSTPNSRQPTNNPTQTQTGDQLQRGIFLEGKVVLDDGTPPPDNIVIERVCNGRGRPEAYTNSKGQFSFQVGQNSAIMSDASVSGPGQYGGITGANRSNNSSLGSSTRGGGGMNDNALMGCELRAALPGFTSSTVNLTGHRSLDNPDVGTIILHRLAKVDGFTFSATSAYAPKDAKKAYEKGREALKKEKTEEAEKQFTKAVDVYPKYAMAWYELGRLYEDQKKTDEAQKAFEASLKADSKYVSPYAELTRMAAKKQDWEHTLEYSEKLLKLNPYVSPEVYFYSAVANYNLKNFDAAEVSTRAALKMDTDHRSPRLNQLMGVILAQKQDYAGAADNLKTYLALAPDSADAPQVKKQLADIEKAMQPGDEAAKKDQPQ